MASMQSALQLYNSMENQIVDISQSQALVVSGMQKMQTIASQNNEIVRSYSEMRLMIIDLVEALKWAYQAGVEAQNRLNESITLQPLLPPPEWDHLPSIEIFHTSGSKRTIQEIESAKKMLQELHNAQKEISESDFALLPSEAQTDILALNQRVLQLGERFREASAAKKDLASNTPPAAADKMNAAVEKMRQQLAQAIQEQNNLNAAMKQGDLTAVNAAYQRLHSQVDGIEVGIRDNIRGQNKFNQTVKNGESLTNKLLNSISSLAKKYVSFDKVKSFLTDSYKAANDRIKAEQRLQSVMKKNNAFSEDGFNLVQGYADELAQVTTINPNVGMAGQSKLSHTVQDPDNLKALTEPMYNLAVGIHGPDVSQDQMIQTAELMNKVMMGELDALSSYGFNVNELLDESQRNMLQFGTEAEKTAVLVDLINSKVDGYASAVADTPEGKILQVQNAWQNIMETIGNGLMPVISQFMDLILNNTPEIEVIFSNVFNAIFSMLSDLIEYAGAVVSFFIDNWSWIEPIIWGIVAALGAYLLMTEAISLALKISAIAQGIFNAIMNANPFVLIASLIVGVIVALMSLWQTNDEFAAGFMRAWYGLLNFFGKVPIFFAKVDMAIGTALMDMKIFVLGIFEDMVNGVIDGVNWLINALNSILGLNMNTISAVDFTTSKKIEADARKKAKQDAIQQMEDNASLKALEREQKVIDMLNEREAKRALLEEKTQLSYTPILVGEEGQLGSNTVNANIDNINKVGEVGKIRDTVDISSEDIKIMREMAEMQSIQNFVTLTPTVSVQTGDIHNGQNVDTIINRIKTALETDIASSAQGVYST